MNKVYISGTGLLTCLGAGIEEIEASLEAGEKGILDSEQYGIACGDISGFFDIRDYTETKYHYLDKASAYTMAVIRMAMDSSGFDTGSYDMYGAGLVTGTEWGCSTSMEMFQEKLLDSDPKFATPFLFSNSFPNSPAALASIEFGIKGYNTVYSGSDTSGLFSVIGAVDALQQGKARTAFAVGTDGLSQTTADFYGDGTSDGAACLVLSAEGNVSVEKYSITETLPDPSYSVQGNTIWGPMGEDLGFGNCMAAAFPAACALAYGDIVSGRTDEAGINCDNASGKGYISLRRG